MNYNLGWKDALCSTHTWDCYLLSACNWSCFLVVVWKEQQGTQNSRYKLYTVLILHAWYVYVYLYILFSAYQPFVSNKHSVASYVKVYGEKEQERLELPCWLSRWSFVKPFKQKGSSFILRKKKLKPAVFYLLLSESLIFHNLSILCISSLPSSIVFWF